MLHRESETDIHQENSSFRRKHPNADSRFAGSERVLMPARTRDLKKLSMRMA